MTNQHDGVPALFTQADWDKLRETVSALEGKNSFPDARAVLEESLERIPKGTPAWVWAHQRLAFSTYKDPQLRSEAKFKRAIEILRGIGLFNPSTADAETLGLGGAILKRMWEHEGREVHLRDALALYRAGWEADRTNGYCGVNAAYILDLLAYLAQRTLRRTGVAGTEAEQYRAEARQLRKEMLKSVKPRSQDKYWSLVTLAEIHFGLDDFDKAKELLQKVHAMAPEPWRFQTTVVQLLNLARWRNVIDGTAPGAAFVEEKEEAKACRSALEALLGKDVEAALGRFRGKVGLALSGGGFRAAFFHLGVMARLAEIDALRHVEVLSTVSGGSIVGAHYYLELKQLLETKPDDTITREDYVAIMRRVQETFLKGVQRNLRMRILSNLWQNLRMTVVGDYTRGKRIGELYESEIYSRVADGNSSCTPRTMPSLLVRPAGYADAENFKPRTQNWLRKAKVPELVVNTTSLNSGHNFQFTASWMGEPPGLTGAEVDMNIRHRRLYYREGATDEIKTFRLGYAVAASSCVPGLFDPLVINGLYPGRVIKLVDGGVHDNQGSAGLLDEECDFILCSDASGQMHDEVNPSGKILGVPLRANDILMDRVRECEFDHMDAMSRSGRLKGLFFIHLKKDLAQEDIAWIGCTEKPPAPQSNQTPYGIDRDIQRRLSEIRTDLDSFSQVEAYALMLSGYQMAEEHALALNKNFREMGGAGTWGGFEVHAPRGEWPFLKLAAIAAKPCDSSDLRRLDLEKQLKVGSGRLFKAWELVEWLRWLGRFLLLVALFAALYGVWWVWEHQNEPALTFNLWQLLLLIFGLLLALKVPAWVVNPKKALKEKALKAGFAVGGWAVAKVHLRFIDPAFLRRGRVDRLLRLRSG